MQLRKEMRERPGYLEGKGVGECRWRWEDLWERRAKPEGKLEATEDFL